MTPSCRTLASLLLVVGLAACVDPGADLGTAANLCDDDDAQARPRSTLNVRASASPRAALVATLGPSQVLSIGETVDNAAEPYVCFDGGDCTRWRKVVKPVQGWAADDYLTIVPCNDDPPGALDDFLAEAANHSPAFGLAVRDLATGEVGHWNADQSYAGASSFKWIWVAAALDAGVAPATIEVDAQTVFRNSDNLAAARVLDALGAATDPRYAGLSAADRVNAFLATRVDIPVDPDFRQGTYFCRWTERHIATGCPTGVLNHFTARDALTFLDYVRSDAFAQRDTLARWASGTTIWAGLLDGLGALPAGSRVQHKVGFIDGMVWHDLGIIERPAGKGASYEVVILTPISSLPYLAGRIDAHLQELAL